MKKRLYELSMMNILFCLMVIFIHVTSEPVGALDKSSWQYLTVMIPWSRVAFVVQGFIFLSGFKFSLKSPDNFNYAKFYLKRLRDIVLPYVLWVTVYYIYFVNHDYFAFSAVELTKYILIGDLVSHFYFIIIIVQFYLLAPLWHFIFKKLNVKYIIGVSLIISIAMGMYLPEILSKLNVCEGFAYNDRVFTTYVIYWVMGCAAGRNIEKFKKFLSDNKIVLISSFALFFVFDFVIQYKNILMSLSTSVHLMYCVFAILFVYYIFSRSNTAQRSSERRFIKDFDRSTFLIYLCHCLFIFIVNDNMYQKGITAIGTRYFIRIIFVYTVSVSLGILWYKIKSVLKRHLHFGLYLI